MSVQQSDKWLLSVYFFFFFPHPFFPRFFAILSPASFSYYKDPTACELLFPATMSATVENSIK